MNMPGKAAFIVLYFLLTSVTSVQAAEQLAESAADSAIQAGTADTSHEHMPHMMANMPMQTPAGADEAAAPNWQFTPAFTLLDAQGKSTTMQDFKGQYLLLTFGFTHCEHICPLMSATMGAVLNQLEVPAAGVFISVDTERDDASISTAYARVFSPRMLGLGGDLDHINEAAANFGISYAVSKTRSSYSVQHTANIFLLDREGDLLRIFPLNATVEEITAAIAASL